MKCILLDSTSYSVRISFLSIFGVMVGKVYTTPIGAHCRQSNPEQFLIWPVKPQHCVFVHVCTFVGQCYN